MIKKIMPFVLLVSLLSVPFTGCSNKQKQDGVVVSNASEFYDALQRKEKTILCDDFAFSEDTVIEINYGVTISSHGNKSTIKNAHFNILGPNVAGESVDVFFNNIILDGNYYILPTGTDKTFEDIYGEERENKRCITVDWGYANLCLNKTEITGYASIDGSALYFGNKFRDGESRLSIENSDFYGNITRNGTIKIFNDKLVSTITNSRFYNNTVGAAGGFVVSNGRATIKNCQIYDNTHYPFADLGFEERGGGAYLGGNNIVMSNCVIRNNETINGGGLGVSSAYSGNGSVLIKNCRFENNRAKDGGAVFVTSLQGQPIDFIGCEFYGNTASNEGAIFYTLPYAHWTKKYNGGQINLFFCSTANNSADDTNTFSFYKADDLLGYIVLKGCLVIDDVAYQSGDKAYNYIASASEALNSGTINDLNITGNKKLQAVKGSEADIVVPVNEYQNWHSTFVDATQECKAGTYIESHSRQLGSRLALILTSSIVGMLLVLTLVVLMILHRKKAPQDLGKKKEVATTYEPIMDEKNRIATLTEREYKIVSLTMAGRTRAEIAKELSFSVGTIKVDLSDIYRKLDCSSRTDLIIRYKDFFNQD